MAKTYHAIKQWEHWLTKFLGMQVLTAEEVALRKLMSKYFGKHVVLIGVPQQNRLLKVSAILHQVLCTPLLHKKNNIKTIESGLNELPLASGSVDLVMVPHTLEQIEYPRQLLSEACRIVKPEGHIIIVGFNPMSFWGIQKIITRHPASPWAGSFYPMRTIKKWLSLADFELVKHEHIFYRMPLQRPALFRKLKLMEWIGSNIFKSCGGIYIIVAKAKVTPLTPIRLRWQQKLSTVRATTIPSMRDRVL